LVVSRLVVSRLVVSRLVVSRLVVSCMNANGEPTSAAPADLTCRYFVMKSQYTAPIPRGATTLAGFGSGSVVWPRLRRIRHAASTLSAYACAVDTYRTAYSCCISQIDIS